MPVRDKRMLTGKLLLSWLLALVLAAGSAWADTGKVHSLAPGAPDVDANSFLLIDFRSGEELVALNQDVRVEPASITKLMTAYILYRELARGRIKLDEDVVEVGKKVKLEKLLRGLIIQSGNDAAVALAEHVAGSEAAFVDRMNETAKELGMNDSRYQNVTGWPDKDHYTTARDIVLLTRALITEFPDRYKLYSEKEFTYNNIKQHNRNKLLWRDDTVDGVKTGHTESAGYCLVASAIRNNMRLISVVLGASSESSRSEASQRLLEYGFRTFETHKLYDGGEVLSEVRVWSGDKKNVAAGVIDDFYVSAGKGRYDYIKGIVQFDKSIDAPIRRGDVLGKIILSDEGVVLKEADLLALEDVGEGGLWSRMSDSVLKVFSD